MANTLFSFTVRNSGGGTLPLSQFKDQVILIVNVASKCGFTPQYKGLEDLYEKFKEQGFTVLGFPCNQFGGQEPGSDEEIQSFCELNFGVKFPLMAKVDVNGTNADPLFVWLKKEAPGLLGTEMIKWNFTKFLVGRDGKVLKRFSPRDQPGEMMEDIEKALKGS